MQQWWEHNMESFLLSKMLKADYGRVVMQSKVLFRHGIDDLLKLTVNHKVPLTVVSGGITEIILASFYAIIFNGEIRDGHNYIDTKHINVIANSFKYEDDLAVDYIRPIIHSMNK